jgi:hypothetical protein
MQKIIKYLYPSYLESKEYKLKFSAGDFAIDNENNQIWLADVRSQGNCVPLAIYSEEKTTIKLDARNVFDDIGRPLKSQYFYRSDKQLYLNSRYSPDIYELKNKGYERIAKIKSTNFMSEKDIVEDDVYGIELSKTRKIQGLEFFFKVNEQYVGRLRGGDFSFFVYDIATQAGKLISMPVDGFGGIISQNNDCLVGILSAGGFKRRFPQQAENVDEEDNPILVKMKF